MKYLILMSLVLVGFGCASKQKSYCDIVDRETKSQQIIEDDQNREEKAQESN